MSPGNTVEKIKLKLSIAPMLSEALMLGAGALGQPRGRVWGGRREEGSGWSTGMPVADSFRCLAKLIQYCKA